MASNNIFRGLNSSLQKKIGMGGQAIGALTNLGVENSSFFGACYNSSTVAFETLSSHPITNHTMF